MTNLVIRLVVSAAAVYAAQWISQWLVANGYSQEALVTVDGVVQAFIFAIVLGILNAIVRPVLLLLTCPITILTLGLFVLVVNAIVFYFATTLVNAVHVAGFVGALLGSVVVTLCVTIADSLLESQGD